ncbi:multi-sensor signal transduction histidine kinase [Candidatus Magnetoovum chiemensis]|nr:multi-sensor signal transduction histidine kinase [Candidatus Magnetoovum chiemensis]
MSMALKKQKTEGSHFLTEDSHLLSKEMSQLLLDVADVMFVLINKSAEVCLVNKKACEVLGYEGSDIIGKNWFDNFLPTDIIESVKGVFDSIIAGNIEPVEYFENPVLTKDKTLRVISWHNSVIKNDSGEIIYILSSGEDVTRRVLTQKALQDSEEFHRIILGSILEAVFITDDTGCFTYIGSASGVMFGYTVLEIARLGNITKLLGGNIFLPDELAQNREIRNIQRQVKHKDGKMLTILISVKSVAIKNGTALYTCRDISELKEAQDKVRHLNLVLHAIRDVNQLITKEKDIDKLLIGICEKLIETRSYYSAWIALFKNGKLQRCASAGFGDEFDMFKAELENGKIPKCIKDRLAAKGVTLIKNPQTECPDCILTVNYRNASVMLVCLDYHDKTYGVLNVSLPNNLIQEEDERSLFQEVADDVAFAIHSIELEQEHNEAIIRQKNKDRLFLMHTRQAKMGEMLSMISHQWRQPLSAINTIANKIKIRQTIDKITKKETIEAMDKIENHVQYLSQTISDFRNFFNPDRAKETVPLSEIIKKSINIIGKSLEANSIKLIQSYESSGKVETYPFELIQVILNLLKNAHDVLIERNIKNPVISIKEFIENDKAVIEIKDNGGGIRADIKENIFLPYYSTKDEEQGTGLGLYMCKTIIEERFKGKITLENSTDGATFTIKLQRKQ